MREQNPIPPREMYINKREGIPLGKIGKRVIGIPIINDGIMCGIMGIPGGGKSSALGVPVIENWKHSAIICDPKNELHRKANVAREKINIINPLLSTSDSKYLGFSPFDYLSQYDNLIEGMKSIVLSLIPLGNNSDPDKIFWTASAQSYLLCGLLHFYHKGFNFAECCRQTYQANGEKLINKILKDSDADAKLFAGQFSGLAPNTFSGIILQATTSIEVFITDEGVKNLITSERRINPDILMDIEKPQHIYLAIPEYKLDTCRGFISLFFDMNLKFFSIQDERQSVPVLFLLDEFAKYNVPSVGNSMALLRSRRVSIMFFCQSRSQIVDIYGREKAKAMFDCLSYTILLGIGNPEDAKQLSEQIGKYERYIPSRMHEIGKDTVREVPIVRPEDLRNPEYVFIIGSNPKFLKLEKNFYFKERRKKIF